MKSELKDCIMNSDVGNYFITPIMEAHNILYPICDNKEFINAIDYSMSVELDYNYEYISYTLKTKEIIFQYCRNDDFMGDCNRAIVLTKVGYDYNEIKDNLRYNDTLVTWLLDEYYTDIFENMKLNGILAKWIDYNLDIIDEFEVNDVFEDYEDELTNIFDKNDEKVMVNELNKLLDKLQ